MKIPAPSYVEPWNHTHTTSPLLAIESVCICSGVDSRSKSMLVFLSPVAVQSGSRKFFRIWNPARILYSHSKLWKARLIKFATGEISSHLRDRKIFIKIHSPMEHAMYQNGRVTFFHVLLLVEAFSKIMILYIVHSRLTLDTKRFTLVLKILVEISVTRDHPTASVEVTLLTRHSYCCTSIYWKLCLCLHSNPVFR